MRKRVSIGLLLAAVGALALIAAGCGGSSKSSSGSTSGGGGGGNVSALPASSCGPMQFKGSGNADYLIASDLPKQGGSRTQTVQMAKAIAYVLDQQNWKAGKYNIGYQDCDDSTAQLGKWDPDKCSANAHAYASNSKLLGVVGTFNSGCAAIEIPVLNQAPGGGLLLLSPANTYGCLTEPCAGDEPEKYYPSGKRNYARVAPSDPNQGAVDAAFLKSKGVKRVSVLNDKEAYGLGVAKNFAGAAKAAGMTVTGFTAYDPKQANFQALFTRIKGQNPDAVFIGGLIDENSGQLINDKVAVLGRQQQGQADAPGRLHHRRDLRPVAGWDAGGGRLVLQRRRRRHRQVHGRGEDVHQRLQGSSSAASRSTRTRSSARRPHRSCSTRSRKSDGTRSDVISKVFATKVNNGLIGSFGFNKNGDLAGAKGAAVLFTIYTGTNHLKTILTTAPDPKLVAAARAEASG